MEGTRLPDGGVLEARLMGNGTGAVAALAASARGFEG